MKLNKLFAVLAGVLMFATQLIPAEAFAATYSEELQRAYNWAYLENITTMSSIDNANMYGAVTRAELAKMLANYAKTVLGLTPDTSASCTFTDTASVQGDLATAVVEACQLGIMGQNVTAFRPYDTITRAEFGTALSRILYGLEDGEDVYYSTHLAKLKSDGIITNDNPKLQELRGWVMLTLSRSTERFGFDLVYKPIIYLYPTSETKVNVSFGTPEKLSHTYPKYNPAKGRNVIAQPNGDLEDIETGRGLYALYREGISNNKPKITEGFVVKGEDIIPFLEEKLAILGLNEHESEEFIVYRLPQMEGNKYNLIRFETLEEQNFAMPLNITPSPDTIIRVMMDWKAIENPIEIKEQQLSTPERNGFTVVERGGSKLN